MLENDSATRLVTRLHFSPIIFATILLALTSAASFSQTTAAAHSRPDFRQLLEKIAAFSFEPCRESPAERKGDPAHIEYWLFSRASDIVEQALNQSEPNPQSPRDRATDALKRLERLSSEINSEWPEESRFHFEILDLPPALVVKMSIRGDDGFHIFGIPEEDSGKPNHHWKRVGQDGEWTAREGSGVSIELFLLHRGPSGNARFLAKVIRSGCAGSLGLAYDAREWDPHSFGRVEQIIQQDGAIGLDDDVKDFPVIGKLQTENALVTLPYCWFSPIDTWDNPSLCALDTYDLSGDDVRFRSRIYNRPDLVPIAKAIEYAEHRDYPAVLSYCASPQVARRLVRNMPPNIFGGEELEVTRTSGDAERVQIGEGVYFDVQKRAGRWLVTNFHAE